MGTKPIRRHMGNTPDEPIPVSLCYTDLPVIAQALGLAVKDMVSTAYRLQEAEQGALTQS